MALALCPFPQMVCQYGFHLKITLICYVNRLACDTLGPESGRSIHRYKDNYLITIIRLNNAVNSH